MNYSVTFTIIQSIYNIFTVQDSFLCFHFYNFNKKTCKTLVGDAAFQSFNYASKEFIVGKMNPLLPV